MNLPNFPAKPLSIALAVALGAMAAQAQTASSATGSLPTVTVDASADASAAGLPKPFAGGQVARGGRIGILGNQDLMDTPFSATNYTQELIQNQQAASVGDVLQNDPAVQVARGFGNYQQVYKVRGFSLFSDDISYNGLYGLLPRQYQAAVKAEPGMRLRFVAFPGTSFTSPHHYGVYLRGTQPVSARLIKPVLVDATTGEITDSRDMPWYLTGLFMSQPLHFGDYGGTPMQIIWAILDIMTIIVLGSGLYLWWVRRKPGAA